MAQVETIGKYKILGRIGRGGMGFVYHAYDPLLGRDVALKTMMLDIAEDEDLRTRFFREAQSAGGLRHPNIVTIFDVGEDESHVPYIAMEYLPGTDLDEIIKSKMQLPLHRKLQIVIQACQGLAYAHSNGVVHRDIKPANIRVVDNREVKIMDFGIARIAASQFTKTGLVMGTPYYMAPEQIRGERVDGRADIFSLGVVLYELLVYRRPYPGETSTSVLFKIIHSNPEPLVDSNFVAPHGLEKVIFKALAKKPEDRFQTCTEFADELWHVYDVAQYEDAVSQPGPYPLAPEEPSPNVAPPAPPVELQITPAAPPVSKIAFLVGFAAVFFIALLLAFAFGLIHLPQPLIDFFKRLLHY